VRITDSFEFEVRDREHIVRGIGTIFDINIIPATRQIFIEFHYEDESGQTQQLTIELDRFFKILVRRQQTL
jgi:hypothetical protein